MEDLSNSKKSEIAELVYKLDDTPNLVTRIILGLQNIFAAFGGIIAVPLVLSGALGLTTAQATAIMSGAIFVAGVATIIQSRKFGPVGARVPCIMGTDFTFVSPAISVGLIGGLPAILGATILGSVVEIVASLFLKPLLKLFPPLVTGAVVCLIGTTLIPVSIDWSAGGVGSSDYGSVANIAIAMVVLIITLLINRYCRGIFSSASVLLGMVVGYIICIPLGKVNFSGISEVAWFDFPRIFEWGINFDIKYALAFIPAYIVTAIETVGCLTAICEVAKVKRDDKILRCGILADGISSTMAGVFGTLPNTTFSQNVALIPLTRNASRSVAITAGVIMVILGLLPKFAAVINSIPPCVLGGAGIVMFGTIAASGIKILSRVEINNRNLLIIATSIGLGLGVTFRPDFVAKLPETMRLIFSSGISTGTIVALILNIILKEDKKQV